MAKKKKTSEDKGPGVPIYIVTFSDMVTLLLTFFVMLLSMAQDPSNELFEQGQTSFKRAMANFGISGFMVNKKSGPSLDYPKNKYPIESAQEQPEDRVVDSRMEILRRVILELEKEMEITPSQIVGSAKDFTATDISFGRGQWRLNENDRLFIDKFTRTLQESRGEDALNIYIVGLGNSERTEKDKFTVSALRAEAVASEMKRCINGNVPWKIYSWGAGAGGEWTKRGGGIVHKNSDIAIAVVYGEGY